jgi:hypothetical protein
MRKTKRDKPAAKKKPLIGSMKGKLITRGNLLRTGVKWDAES